MCLRILFMCVCVAGAYQKLGESETLPSGNARYRNSDFVVNEAGPRLAYVKTHGLKPRNVMTVFDISHDGKFLRQLDQITLKSYDDSMSVGVMGGGRFVYSISLFERTERAIVFYDLVKNESWSFSAREILSDESFAKVNQDYPSHWRRTRGYCDENCEFYFNPSIPEGMEGDFLPFVVFDLIDKTAKECLRPKELKLTDAGYADEHELRAMERRMPDGPYQLLPSWITGKGGRKYILSDGGSAYRCDELP